MTVAILNLIEKGYERDSVEIALKITAGNQKYAEKFLKE